MKSTFKQRQYQEALAVIDRECIECKRAIRAGDEEARPRLDLLRMIAKGYRELMKEINK